MAPVPSGTSGVSFASGSLTIMSNGHVVSGMPLTGLVGSDGSVWSIGGSSTNPSCMYDGVLLYKISGPPDLGGLPSGSPLSVTVGAATWLLGTGPSGAVPSGATVTDITVNGVTYYNIYGGVSAVAIPSGAYQATPDALSNSGTIGYITEDTALTVMDGDFENTWAYYTQLYGHGNGQDGNYAGLSAMITAAQSGMLVLAPGDAVSGVGVSASGLVKTLLDSAAVMLANQNGPEGKRLNSFISFRRRWTQRFCAECFRQQCGPEWHHD